MRGLNLGALNSDVLVFSRRWVGYDWEMVNPSKSTKRVYHPVILHPSRGDGKNIGSVRYLLDQSSFRCASLGAISRRVLSISSFGC